MARSDETYLESFIDHISTLPHEIRRNLDLMQDMDKSCSYVDVFVVVEMQLLGILQNSPLMLFFLIDDFS
jgi:hypothetical protein